MKTLKCIESCLEEIASIGTYFTNLTFEETLGLEMREIHRTSDIKGNTFRIIAARSGTNAGRIYSIADSIPGKFMISRNNIREDINAFSRVIHDVVAKGKNGVED